MPFCTNCGNEVEEKERYCANCGSPQGDRKEETIIEYTSDTKKGNPSNGKHQSFAIFYRKVGFFIAGLVGCFILIYGGLNLYNNIFALDGNNGLSEEDLSLIDNLLTNDDVSQEPIEPEEIVEAEPEETELEHEAEEIADEQEEAEIEEEPKNEVVVSVDVLRLRSGPSTDYEIIDRLIKGSILKVVGEQDEWLQVVLPYKEGWVHGNYVVKPEDPEKLYEVLPVEVQPIGYTKEEVASFVEEFTSFGCSDLVLPEFNHPNEINDLDLIRAIQESKRNVVPKYYRFYGASYQFSFKDMQEAARAVFGIDLKDIQLYSDRDILGVERLSGCAFSTETRVLNVIEKEKEFLVDVVHLTYYHCPYEMDTYYLVSEDSRRKDYDCFEDFLDNNLDLGDSQNTDEIIEQHIKTFPVRRYILSKEGDGILYIRQSYILSGN